MCQTYKLNSFNCGPDTLCQGFDLQGSYTICEDSIAVNVSLDFPEGIDITKAPNHSLAWVLENRYSASGSISEFDTAAGIWHSRSVTLQRDYDLGDPWTAFEIAENDNPK